MEAARHGVERPADLRERLRQVAAGDRAAQAWLYDRFAPTLYRRIRARHGRDPRLDAEELLHDLFVWCLRGDDSVLTRFAERNPGEACTEYRLEGYLWGLVAGLVSNRRRSERRAPQQVPADEMPLPGSGDPERDQAERDTATRLAACLEQSGVRLFLYFKLRFVEGLTPEEVGRVTGWERGAIYKMKAVLNRAVERCAQTLGIDR